MKKSETSKSLAQRIMDRMYESNPVLSAESQSLSKSSKMPVSVPNSAERSETRIPEYTGPIKTITTYGRSPNGDYSLILLGVLRQCEGMKMYIPEADMVTFGNEQISTHRQFDPPGLVVELQRITLKDNGFE